MARVVIAIAVLLAAAGMVVEAAAAAPLSLAGHRAIYDLTLADADSGTAIANVSGRLVMEFSGSACAGYTTKLRFVTQTEDADGGRQIVDSRSSTFEAADGSMLNFENETYTDDRLAEASRGVAKRKDGAISVSLTMPSAKRFDLASAVVFPTGQMQRIIESAIDGKSFVSVDVYDGSEDGETVFATAGVIGPESHAADDVGEETAVSDAGIAGLRHWPLTVSYFNTKEGGDETPFYVMSFIMYENGVGRRLTIDYGDFALKGRLTGLEMLPASPCP